MSLIVYWVFVVGLVASVITALYAQFMGYKFPMKLGVITGCMFFALAALWPPSEKLQLGIDLSGGTILVYEVTRTNTTTMDELISALKNRVDPEGVREIPIRKIGGDRIEIILPNSSAEEVEDVKRKLTEVGALSFRILANRKHDSAVIERALSPTGATKPPPRYVWAKLGEISTGTNPIISGKTLSDPKQSWKRDIYDGVKISLTGKTAAGVETSEQLTVERNTGDTLTLTTAPTLKNVNAYQVEYNPSNIHAPDPSTPSPTDPIIREERSAQGGHVALYILCVADRAGQEVTGKYLSRVYSTQDERLQPAVGFTFDNRGRARFRTLTREHLPEEGGQFKYQLAIVLDDVVPLGTVTQPGNRRFGDYRRGRTGLQAQGSHPPDPDPPGRKLARERQSDPAQEEKIGPTLGEDTIAKGVFAIEMSMFVVPIFMLVYYRFAGFVAVIALVLNMILLVGSMALMQVTFSLPGLAGLALTIGMAVDANVLVFERMREEKERGATLAQQIRNGFNRAWVTIFDSHVTLLLSAIVLAAIGTEEVRGFALTMIIGMLWNLFTAVFVSRVIFEYCYSKGWIKQLTMFKMLKNPNFDFITTRHYYMGGSVILIVLGLAAFFLRGKTIYNIDFTGGALVTIRLNEKDPKIASLSDSERANFVRREAGVLPDVTVESLKVSKDKSLTRFNIRTTQEDLKVVKDDILKAFDKTLQRVELTWSEPRPIPGKPASTPPAKDATVAVESISDFAGGREYTLTFNTSAFSDTQKPADLVSAEFTKVLEKNQIAIPTSHFKIVTPKRGEGTAPDEALSLILRTDLEPDVAKTQLTALAASLADNRDLLFERITVFGGTVAGETRTLALMATLASWLIIIGYLWFRFKSLTYGLAAVLAVVHDVLITLGAVAVSYWLALIPGVREFLLIEQFKIDLPMIAAFLTLIGFSVNDTIVIFDRIREIRGKTPYLTEKMVNDALNQTLSRTILTSLTAWLVVVILFILGGEGLHGFAFALTVGFLSGTYSTIYIATPILIDWIGTKPPEVASKKKELAAAR